MARVTLVFTLSDCRAQTDLLHEFTLHDDVVASACEIDGGAAISVEVTDSVSTLWDVRATIGMFDEGAQEQHAR